MLWLLYNAWFLRTAYIERHAPMDRFERLGVAIDVPAPAGGAAGGAAGGVGGVKVVAWGERTPYSNVTALALEPRSAGRRAAPRAALASPSPQVSIDTTLESDGFTNKHARSDANAASVGRFVRSFTDGLLLH